MNLPERLRALPQFEPPAGGWQRLSARMNARRRRWIATGGGLALAASVLVAVGVAGLRPLTTPPPQSSPASGGGSIDVAHLIDRSQRLETELRRARPQVAVWDSGRAQRADLIERELALIDASLSYADADAAETQQLWNRRVKLMNALVDLHQNEAPALHYASYQY